MAVLEDVGTPVRMLGAAHRIREDMLRAKRGMAPVGETCVEVQPL